MLSCLVALLAAIALWGCSGAPTQTSIPTPDTQSVPTTESSTNGPKNVLAVESFLADIAQNVAGDRLKVASLIPLGTDPHAFEPTPIDVAKVTNSDLLIVNGAGLEEFLEPMLKNPGGIRLVAEASAGLDGRNPHEDEEGEHAQEEHAHEGDPHFWLDPTNVVKYAENIRDALIKVDPEGSSVYAANAQSYTARLRELDGWIAEQVKVLPQEQRLLVTNHESLGYFADRYGFKVVGTVVPSVGTGASPSAQQMAQLIEHIKKTGARAIFLETGTNPQLAERIAQETGIKVVTQLDTHSLTPHGGESSTYLDMMRHNTRAIVEALR